MTTATQALRVPDLIDAATTRTGLTEFGDMWFVEPLTVLVASLNEEARLSALGLEMTRRRLSALLADRLRLREFQRRHPEVLDQPVVVGAAIGGLPRTGSTLLHRLLAASPQLTATLSWETAYPLPFPDEPAGAPERKRRARERMAAFGALSPDFGDIHTVVWDGPEEDVILLDRSFTTMSFDSFYWTPGYGTWLRSYDQRPAYRELREWLQVLEWQDPDRAGKRWVLKAPHHLTAIETLLDTFPTSRIVMTHRSPVEAVPSYASMVASISRQYSDTVDPVAVGRYWSQRFTEALRRFDGVRQARPDRFVDVAYRSLLADPLGAGRRVLAELGLPARPDDDAAFMSYLERNRQERHGSHHYTAADFGLSPEQLERDFSFYTEAYL